jgi:hypothetical protein
MPQSSSITVEADSNGNARLRIRHRLQPGADPWEHGGDYSLILTPEDREALIDALERAR